MIAWIGWTLFWFLVCVDLLRVDANAAQRKAELKRIREGLW